MIFMVNSVGEGKVHGSRKGKRKKGKTKGEEEEGRRRRKKRLKTMGNYVNEMFVIISKDCPKG